MGENCGFCMQITKKARNNLISLEKLCIIKLFTNVQAEIFLLHKQRRLKWKVEIWHC